MKTGFKVWFVFCATMAVLWLGVLVWAIFKIVPWLTQQTL
jgi:hypothetical protein